MRILEFSRYALSIWSASALLTGCGRSQQPIGAPVPIPQNRIATTPVDRGSWTLPRADVGAGYKASGPLLYVVDRLRNAVTVYHADSRDPAPIATIWHGLNLPAGDCLDSHGTLYVTNQTNSGGGWISEYPLGETKASVSIRDGNTPWFCAIDSKDNLWVTNIGNPNNVTEYLYGSKKPHFIITKGMASPASIAIDQSGNVYVANSLGSLHSYVDVYPPGGKTSSRSITDGVTYPVGIGIDSSSTLYVTNAYAGNIEEYLSGQSKPHREITQGLDFPVAPVLSSKGWLYVTNQGTSDNVAEFSPNSVKPSKRHVSRGVLGPIGVTYYPPLLP